MNGILSLDSLAALGMILGDIVVKVSQSVTTYALGEHDWVTSKLENIMQNVQPCNLYSSLPEIACKTVRPFKPELGERWQL